ncbi:MAG: GNVR domain-containing protein [Edaphobacter sp.]
MLQETLAHSPATSSLSELEAGATPHASEEQGIDLIDVATLLLREKKTILKFVVAVAALMAFIVFVVMKPMFTAEATFLPPQNAPGSGLSQVASQLGSLGVVGSLAGLKTPGDVYLGILESRTIAEGIIRQFDLQSVYKAKRISDAEKELKSRRTFLLAKNTLISISVEDHDPKRATDIANAYLDALREQNGKLALTESAQRRYFFEQQLEREKNALADAEVELKRTEEQTGLIAPNGQAQVEIDSMAQIRAQITSLQVQLVSLKQGATDENPQVIRLETQIAGLQQQLQRLQSDPSKREPGNVQLPTARVPELALEYVRKQREVKYHETLFELLAKQYEGARLDESRDAPVLQVVDRATLPDKKSGPHRLLLVLAAAFVGAFLGTGWVLLRQVVAKLRQDPARAQQLEALREAALRGH